MMIDITYNTTFYNDVLNAQNIILLVFDNTFYYQTKWGSFLSLFIFNLTKLLDVFNHYLLI